MPSPQELADLYSQLSLSVNNFRLSHQTELSANQFAAFGTIASSLLHLSDQFIGEAIADTLANVQVDANQIIATTKAAQSAVKTIQDVQKVFAIASAAVTLGLAISSGNVAKIAAGLAGLAAAIGGAAASTTGAGGPAPKSLSGESKMKISIDPVISSRIKTAWGQLTPDQRNRIAPAILHGNQQAVRVSQTGRAPSVPAAHPPHVLAFSALSDDHDGVVNRLEEGVVLDVGADGVIWGTGKYEQFDPGWGEAFAEFVESFLPVIGGKHPFIAAPQIIPMPDSVQIALAGDWGTGDWRTKSNPAPSTDVGLHMSILQPHLTIHLGDVYYAGTGGQEEHNLVRIWPHGSIGSLALNSNHEMYSGAKAYFKAISDEKGPFAMQKGCSYFALENSKWVVLGLDSAYYAPEHDLYMDGSLGPEGGPQLKSLQSQVASAMKDGKKVILLTHHNGLEEDGSSTTGLWTQVMSAFPAGTGPAYWYWGHEHAGVVYQPKPPREGDTPSILCRCCGHGGMPWGHATKYDNNPNVVWYEKRSAKDPDIPQRVLNGFAMLYLDGPKIEEVFYDENGGGAWRSG
jgi:hypothetical protein